MTNLAKFSFFSYDADVQQEPNKIEKLKQELNELKKSTHDYIKVHLYLLSFVDAIQNQINSLTKEKLVLQSKPELTVKQSIRVVLVQSAIEKQQSNLEKLNKQIECSEANRLIIQRQQTIQALESQIESLSLQLNSNTPHVCRKLF